MEFICYTINASRQLDFHTVYYHYYDTKSCTKFTKNTKYQKYDKIENSKNWQRHKQLFKTQICLTENILPNKLNINTSSLTMFL